MRFHEKKLQVSTHFCLKLDLQRFNEKTESEAKSYKLTVCSSNYLSDVLICGRPACAPKNIWHRSLGSRMGRAISDAPLACEP